MTFTEFCAANNIKLQPQDLTFIKKTLKRIPKTSHKAVVKRYTEIWVTTRDATERSVAATNAAALLRTYGLERLRAVNLRSLDGF